MGRRRAGATRHEIGAGARRLSGEARHRVEAVLDDLPDVSRQVTRARRGLAARIDPTPRRRPGLPVVGLLVIAVGAVVWALLERRAAADRDPTPAAPVPDEHPISTTPPGGTALVATPAGANGNRAGS